MYGNLPERVLRAFARGMTEELWWREDEGHLVFYASCPDVFHHGVPDVEEIHEATVEVLEQAASDLYAATGNTEHLGALYAARIRNMRPHELAYVHFDEDLWDLFDACGPVRQRTLTNPGQRPARTRQ